MEWLPAIITLLEQSKYPLIFAGSFIEGSAVMMTTGLLWHIGTVTFWPAYIALLLGDIVADCCWYAVGYFGGRRMVSRWGHFLELTPEIFEKVERRFHRYHTRILIISKLTMGLGFATAVLTVAGMLRVPFWRFFVINLLGGIVWVLFLMGVGYYAGNILNYIPKNFQIAAAIAVPFVLFFGLRYVNSALKRIDW